MITTGSNGLHREMAATLAAGPEPLSGRLARHQ
jgi:hypothetical protein